jgi:glycosyltransferase involved in cell wall biosynthesis
VAAPGRVVRVAFVVNDLQLSGGVGVVVEHVHQLNRHHGIDATLVLAAGQVRLDWSHRGLPDVRVIDLDAARDERYDVAVATWWETAYPTLDLAADRYAYFVQSMEDRFFGPDDPQRMAAALTHDLPLAMFTEAQWIAETLEALRPDIRVRLVRNGIAKDVFAGPAAPAPSTRGPLRVLVEGDAHVSFKGVREALAATRAMSEPSHVTLVTRDGRAPRGTRADRVLGRVSHADLARLYGESHVVLKLSRVEGMYGPPLEGFHMGATCVTTPVTGHDEYVEHGWNGLVVDWDDTRGTARALDLLACDRRVLHYLRLNALLTARAWPSWEQQGAVMAAVLRAIHRDPPPSATAAAGRLLADLRAGVQAQTEVTIERRRLRRLLPVDRLERFLERPAGRLLQRIWAARQRR